MSSCSRGKAMLAELANSISPSMDTASNISDLQQQLHLVTDNSGYIISSTIFGFSHGN